MGKKFNNIHVFCLFSANVLAWGCTNIYMPCLPNVAADFGIGDFLAKLTISLGLIGGIMGRIFIGPMSDFFGRKKLFIYSLCFAILGMLGCYFSHNIYTFLFFRFFQGIGSGAIFVQVISILSDTQTGDRRARLLSLVELAWPIAWGVAPLIGAYISDHFNWRVNFLLLVGCLSVIAIVLSIYLPETLRERKSEKKFKIKKLFQGYVAFSKHKLFLSYALIPGFVLGGYMIFAINGPFLYKSNFGYSAQSFALLQSFPLIAYFFTIFLYRFIILRFGFVSAFKVGFGLYTVYSIAILIFMINIIPQSPFAIISLICAQCLANAFLIPAGSASALQYAQNSLGTAASFIAIVRNFIVSSCTCISGFIPPTTFSVFSMIFITIMMVFFLTYMRKRVMKKIKNNNYDEYSVKNSNITDESAVCNNAKEYVKFDSKLSEDTVNDNIEEKNSHLLNRSVSDNNRPDIRRTEK